MARTDFSYGQVASQPFGGAMGGAVPPLAPTTAKSEVPAQAGWPLVNEAATPLSMGFRIVAPLLCHLCFAWIGEGH